MTDSIFLSPDQVPPHLRGADGYTGRKFAARIVPADGRVRIPGDAGFWDGGTRDTYFAILIATGAHIELPRNSYGAQTRDHFYVLTRGQAVVRHSIFMGKDSGLTFYMLAEDVAPMLPAPTGEPLSEAESIVLGCAVCLVSSYRRESAARAGIRGAAYDSALESLKARGFLRANNSATPEGKNASTRRMS